MIKRLLHTAGNEFRGVVGAKSTTHGRYRDHLITILIVTAIVELICSVVGYFLERHVPDTDIHTFGQALFWTSTQLLSVSSSVKNPLSTGGQVLDVLMETYAITVVAALAGSTATFLQRRGKELDAEAKA